VLLLPPLLLPPLLLPPLLLPPLLLPPLLLPPPTTLELPPDVVVHCWVPTRHSPERLHVFTMAGSSQPEPLGGHIVQPSPHCLPAQGWYVFVLVVPPVEGLPPVLIVPPRFDAPPPPRLVLPLQPNATSNSEAVSVPLHNEVLDKLIISLPFILLRCSCVSS
jgi:hypothetical protein